MQTLIWHLVHWYHCLYVLNYTILFECPFLFVEKYLQAQKQDHLKRNILTMQKEEDAHFFTWTTSKYLYLAYRITSSRIITVYSERKKYASCASYSYDRKDSPRIYSHARKIQWIENCSNIYPLMVLDQTTVWNRSAIQHSFKIKWIWKCHECSRFRDILYIVCIRPLNMIYLRIYVIIVASVIFMRVFPSLVRRRFNSF